ncbi:MAG: DegT/DnrJ/EryC1/StrS family aminotransferase [bacterium]
MISVSKPIIGDEEIEAVVAVMRSGIIAQGPKVKELEQNFAKYCGTRHAIALNSGTAALHGGLYALGIGDNDEVITSPFTFVASANPILMLGGKVVFADISEENFCIDPLEVEKQITNKTKAIIPVDLYGQIYDYRKIKKIADQYSLKLLEDACQSIGAIQDNVLAGSFGDAAAFSLYATKNMMCGEGGMLTTNDDDIAERCRRFRHHGQSEQTRYEYWDIGFNYRMMDIQAAIALVQLNKIDDLNKKRIDNAKKLTAGLVGIKGLILPKIPENDRHVFHQYTIRVTEDFKITREKLIESLKKDDIGAGIYYPKPLHLHPHFSKFGYAPGDFPVAEKMANQVLSLPVHPGLTDNELSLIIDSIRKYA